ncbi:hypothetical protein [Paenibacillus sp. Marseille-Q4541]|uniref:DUF7507 domain-containing protein n=1 Tax=Paenibacillus sp. Marseille-Q4541 TaxID=2831522 RepID=UPI001BA7E492|nr:hypothetical protein [Paenibacillus sp. Marseille-Q4541]
MDNIRPTDDMSLAAYWMSSGTSNLFDAAQNQGAGGIVSFTDLLRISKGAELISSEECDCKQRVTLDIYAKAANFQYFPSHPLDVVFVLDVTASMMTSGSTKFAQAKRAIISTIDQMWAVNRATTVTIVPYGRAVFHPNPGPVPGFSYDYPGTLFTWRRSSSLPGNYIGQILGYRNQSFVNATSLTTFEALTAPLAASVELSLYNYYNYYKIRYSDIYDNAGNPLPDTVLANYIANIYDSTNTSYTNNQINSVAAGIPLTPAELSYSMNDTGYTGNSILENLVWAIPYAEDTNTEAGIQAAYQLFTTSGFAQSDDMLRRAVLLITDGQSNRSINPQNPDALAALGDTDADFFSDIPGDPWKYFVYLEQTLPTLVGEISNRSSTFDEIILASQRLLDISTQLKDPEDGNASLYALGINIDAQTPGPYTRQNVIELLQSTVTAPAYFKEANTSDPDAQIAELLNALVQNLFELSAGCRVVLQDQIHTSLFSYLPGSIKIRGIRDGLLLKSPNQPAIIDPTDPDYTVYPKAPLLPDVDDSNVDNNGTIIIDFNILPLGLLTKDSKTLITISYDLQTNVLANGDSLHTNVDTQTFITYIEPNHTESAEPIIDYSAAPQSLYFQTPIVACHCTPLASLGLSKFADRSSASPNEEMMYFIEVTNSGTLPLTDTIVEDPLLGFYYIIPLLEPHAVYVTSFPFTIPAGTPSGDFVNTVTVTNNTFADPFQATATVVIAIGPSLLFRKTVDKTEAYPGEVVLFTLTIMNDGIVDLINVRVTDELLGIDTTIDQVPQGATVSTDFPYIIPSTAIPGSTIVNTATTVVDHLPPIEVGAIVEVLSMPLLSLEKLVNETEARPGTTIIFTMVATNRGNVTLTNVTISDPTLDLNQTIGTIAIGETITIDFPFLIPLETPPKMYINTTTILSEQTEPTYSSVEVTVLPTPSLGVSKIPDRLTAEPGETISYNVIISNPGNVPLSSLHIMDELLGIDRIVPGLAVGESRSIKVSYQVPNDALIGSQIVNLLLVTSQEAGTVEAEATVEVIGEGLLIFKTVEPSIVMPGEIVIYSLTVTNQSNVPQTNVLLEDEQIGFSEVVSMLNVGDTIVRSILYTIPDLPNGTVIHNRFTCSSDQTVPRSTEAEVIVYTMLTGTVLQVTKVPNTNFTTPGSTIIYTVTVTNMGDATACNIIIHDSLTGTTQTIAALAIGEEQMVTFSYVVPQNTTQGTMIHNQVTVTSPQTNPVQSESNVTVLLPYFLLSLAHVVDHSVADPGSWVYFTITVENTSEYTLTNVRVFDNLTDFGTTISSLVPGESREFIRPFQIPLDSVGNTEYVNIATAFSNETPYIQAPASVTSLAIPDYTITETVNKPIVSLGEIVFFTITIKNVGNVDLIHFQFVASLLDVVYETELFPIGGVIEATFPYVIPDTKKEIVITSPLIGEASNASPKYASASVIVIPEKEE